MEYALSDSSFLLYHQVKSTLKCMSSKGIAMGHHNTLDNQLREVALGRGVVASLYKLLGLSSPNNNISIQARWEKDVGAHLTPAQWDSIWKNSMSMSNCVRYKIIQMKILHRAYITPTRLLKTDQSLTDLCWHGCGEVSTLLHLLWNCPAIKLFWTEVVRVMSEILNIAIPLCPRICLLGGKLESVRDGKMQKIIALAYLAVKRIILLNWKVRKPICFNKETWLLDFLELLSMERAVASLHEYDQGSQGLWDIIREYYVDSSNSG